MNKFKFGDKVIYQTCLYVVTAAVDDECFLISEGSYDAGIWADASKLTPATNWVKCADKSPPFNTYVLIWDGEDQDVDWLSDTAPNEFKESHITHWMPLPAPPVEAFCVESKQSPSEA